MEAAKKFKLAINRSFNEERGVFWKCLSDEQIATYTMEKVHEFARMGGRSLKASLVIGRQSNKLLQDARGNIVPVDRGDARGQYEEVENYDTTVHILNESVQVTIMIATENN